MASDGFFKLGEAILGGGIDREDAFLEGQEAGSRINLRGSQTKNALAQARLRQQEADQREKLGDALIAANLDPGLAPLLASGVSDFSDVTGGLGDIQEQGFRGDIADIGRSVEERQASAQAVQGTVAKPIQFGPGGELGVDVFKPQGIFVTPTGEAQIGADVALAGQRTAAGRLSDERRLHPDRFKNSTVFNLGGVPLGDAILGDIGESTIPADIRPEAATGPLGALRSGANVLFDIANADLPFPDTSTAENALKDLANRVQIVGQQSIPGRPNVTLLQMFATFGVEPNDFLRSDQRSIDRMSQTSSFLGGEIDRLRRELNSGRLTPTKTNERESGMRSLAGLKRDIDVVLSRFNAPKDGAEQTGDTDLPPGWSVTVR